MNIIRFRRAVVTLAVILSMASAEFVLAQGQGNGKPGGGGGGGTAAYTIVDLPAPDYEVNGGQSPAIPESISDVSGNGTVLVVGNYEALDGAAGTRACCWTVSSAGTVVAEDLGDWLWEHDLDVNSAGIISGQTIGDRSPALLLPNGQLVVLPGADFGTALRLNNLSALGAFQVVGGDVVWDVMVDGTVLATTLLTDSNGTKLYAQDINDSEQIAGHIIVDNWLVPAIGEFDSAGQLQIATRANPNPNVIAGFNDFQIDNCGNLLGYGWEPNLNFPFGVIPHAVIWPAAGGAIDLVAEQGLNSAQANGIALVGGIMQVVGNANEESGGITYLYTGDALSDLGSMSEGDQPWDFWNAAGINDSGMICGHGKVGKRRNYKRHGYLLLPNSP